jgi:hypothetical protein
VTALLKQYAGVVKRLADELLQARWTELPGSQVEHILREAGVRRARATNVAPEKRTGASDHELYYERRAGVTRPSAKPDPLRRAAVFERRCDGYVA